MYLINWCYRSITALLCADGLVKSPSASRTRECTAGGWGWIQLNFIQPAGEGTPSLAWKKTALLLFTKLSCLVLLLTVTACAGKGVHSQSKEGQFYLQQGIELTGQKKYDLAISALTLSLDKDPDNEEALFWRARAAALGKHYALAIQDATALLALNPDDTAVLLLRAKIYLAQKKFDLAENDLQQALQQVGRSKPGPSATRLEHTRAGPVPGPADLYYDLGTVKMEAGRFKQAIHCFSRAIALKKTFVSAYNNRGTAFFKQGIFSRALADFSRAIDLNPRQARYFFNRALCYIKMANRQKALADLSKALELHPGFALARYNRGLLLVELGQEDLGCQDLKRACDQAGLCNEWRRQQRSGRCPCAEQ